ncbi:maleylpyruvate isomerase family mycothiol-dependent enzyme [Actinoplanes sp. TBRC 11911]|uniref:maleylpyruvate isomerase family mycothiol-dependent enzyme n=1 Tax=Actinoplanes sp. TBRC 11911 TaxID=2729386 RepID=UPI00145C7956|nr:maleylpyruvate isomerase family mycothiol-dependent enzyme [Actinoplanes sp. TBRC 11911]NMO57114.1 maleylpyruvate isomerase family mycothiol-dependent enzyme [Actinoplanes sp. TBRC 11911]
MQTPPFDELLSLIDARSSALRSAVAVAPGIDVSVPGCPDWTLFDLVDHLGAVQRAWAVIVTAADPSVHPDLGEREVEGELLEWSAESTSLLLAALRAVGPDSPAWAWWDSDGAPHTSGAIARHQVQEAAVHAFDAQEAAGVVEPLPGVIAVDGVGEFLAVPLRSLGEWPHRPARIRFDATDGPSWTVDLTATGAVLDPAASGEPVATVRAPASDLVLALYGRKPYDDLDVDGDRDVLRELREWAVVD